MKFDINILIGVGGFALGLVGIGYAIGSRKKLNDISEKLETKIDEISWNLDSDVKIEETVVKEAIDRAVERKVAQEVNRAARNVTDRVRRDMENEVRTAVKAQYPDIRKSITDRVTVEVSKINVKTLTDAVREEARDKVVEKFDGELDDLLEKFNNDLDNVSKIYKSIATKMSGDSSRDLKISLG